MSFHILLLCLFYIFVYFVCFVVFSSNYCCSHEDTKLSNGMSIHERTRSLRCSAFKLRLLLRTKKHKKLRYGLKGSPVSGLILRPFAANFRWDLALPFLPMVFARPRSLVDYRISLLRRVDSGTRLVCDLRSGDFGMVAAPSFKSRAQQPPPSRTGSRSRR